MASQAGSNKPFSKNKYNYPTHALDGTVGYPVDHSVNDGPGGAHPKGTAPLTGPIGGLVKAEPLPGTTKKGMGK